ncbi:hypothetical protein E2C01_005980 [Portunus trituberculatus]|uniref:Uncharacterized protein n=1 Tax=Portunus trituberculatus TaxID=210409 RepID=A0A5B7CY16_PORTR|nr:hypothetical protein [Portunus trituberculatus]
MCQCYRQTHLTDHNCGASSFLYSRSQVCFDHSFTDGKSGPMFALPCSVDMFISNKAQQKT